MSERRFLNFVFTEGMLLIILGLCVLILPKLTSLTFGVMLSSAFITYGLYKAVMAIFNRNYISNIFWSIFLGLYILTIGILLLFVPKINLLWLIALIGVYFLLETISSTVFISKVRSIFNYIGCKCFSAIILFLISLIIIITLPLMSFWTVAILSGIAMLIKGMAKITLSLVNRNNFNI